jgi:hypothetical protein
MTRRESLLGIAAGTLAASSTAAAAPPEIDPAIVQRNDALADALLRKQNTDPVSRWRGACADDYGLYPPGSAAQILETFSASFVCPSSRFFRSETVLDRMKLAAGYLERSQSPDGFISLLSTNFNSPPDTGFVTHLVATSAAIARKYGHEEVVRIVQPFLIKAGGGLAIGGIHTPNHRWVVSSALAQIHELFPDPRYVKRIDQWLAEGIDIDSDGQFTERSMLTYNAICDRAFVVLSSKLKRPELLDPVRKNLNAMLYLLHPNGELVTEISRRQDVNVRGDAARYWFPLTFMAQADGNGQFAAVAKTLTPANATLAAMLEYPQLTKPLPAFASLPDDFEKPFPGMGIVRIRRQETSATIILNGNSRFFTLRHGDAVINAVRFATAFFGKGQFVPGQSSKTTEGFDLSQSLVAPYYEPLDHPVNSRNWGALRSERRQNPVCRLEQKATITETRRGFRLRLQADGTADVPLAVEINFREGGTLVNCVKSQVEADSWVLPEGQGIYTLGKNSIRFGPGIGEHLYTRIRGAEPKLSGPSVYLTGYTPFDRTIEFECL